MEEIKENQKSKFTIIDFLNWVGVISISLLTIGAILIILISFWPQDIPKQQNIQLNYHLLVQQQNDTINTFTKQNDTVFVKTIIFPSQKSNYDSAKKEISLISDTLKQNLQLLQEVKKEYLNQTQKDDFFSKLYTSILALILTIGGFFGFKSIFEIRKNAEKEARITAEKISKKTAEVETKEVTKRMFSELFTKEYEAKITKDATEIATEIYRKDFESKLKDVWKRINKDESDDIIENNSKTDKNPFDKNHQ